MRLAFLADDLFEIDVGTALFCESTIKHSRRFAPHLLRLINLKRALDDLCDSTVFAARQTVMSPSSLGLMVLLGSTQAGLPSGSAD